MFFSLRNENSHGLEKPDYLRKPCFKSVIFQTWNHVHFYNEYILLGRVTNKVSSKSQTTEKVMGGFE